MFEEEFKNMPTFLHEGLVCRSDKQNSAQGSVFYVKKSVPIGETGISEEYVLKIVSISF